MRSTSNPAFRNLPVGGYGPGFQPQAQAYPGYPPTDPGYGYQAAPASGDRPMTVDDVVTKTGMTLGLAILTGIITSVLVLSGTISPYPPLIIGGLVALVLSLVVIFKKNMNPGLVLAYAAFEGVFLGAITGVFESLIPGIAVQAILGTALVFITMLVVYKTGAVKVTPRLTKWIIGATCAAAGLMLINLVLSLFGVNMGIRGNGTLAIIVSLVFIGIAAFNFLLDFDMADQLIRSGAPSKMAWYVAFGLMTTLVWLYLEILRLLYALQSSD